ncbi:DNA-processing protein DprA [Sinorhizobium meliloti]|uniref:DNA-processing protein DprA n=1 Tax=Rhizobium meliloti TaxID=382 RepID=UPI00237FCFC0|nr:DNA-processing protein DprA [Sinorhizobium meliloti]
MFANLARHEKTPTNEMTVSRKSAQNRYVPPASIQSMPLSELMDFTGRSTTEIQKTFLNSGSDDDPTVFLAGDLRLLKHKSIAVIGARSVSVEGRARATRLARELSTAGVVVSSGLAKGVDAAAHRAAIDAGGHTVGVIGTPLDKAYPVENAALQQEIYKNHLLVSQFRIGQRTYQSDFPKRNRLMAALSDGSVIVEASDTSGTLHQATECVKLGRWLFILKSVVENEAVKWPQRFLSSPKTVVLTNVSDILSRIG